MSQTERWTIRALIDWTTSFLRGKGSDSARLEAEVLLAFATNKSRVELYVDFDSEPSEESRARFRELVRRRGLGEPVAYLVGKKEFYSLDFAVDRRVLIPRPETEQLVLETVEFVKKSDRSFGKPESDESKSETKADEKTWRFCDVGTGSGCVAIALAKNVRNCEVAALDASADALAVARANAEKHSVADRVRFVESDLFAALPRPTSEEEKFDAIVSNPPYVSESEYEALEPTVRAYEPKLALVGGPTGAETPIRLAEQAADFVRSGGKLFFELSPTTVERVANALKQDGRWEDARVFDDLSRLPRYIVATRK